VPRVRHRIELIELGGCARRLVDIVLEGFDAGIRTASSVPGDMIAIPLGRSLDFVVVGSPRYLSKNPPTLEPSDLVRHKCIRARWAGGGIYRWEFERDAEKLKALLVVGPEHLRRRMTTDVEIEIALDRRGAPVDVRVVEPLGTLSRKRTEVLKLGQHDPAHVRGQGER
jgi:DNA-binding transcriptional LysR family regulator